MHCRNNFLLRCCSWYTDELAEIIDETLGKGGNVVIPSFAVGRTQELLYFIREIKDQGLVKSVPDFPVYIDSPLAKAATTVFCGDLHGYLSEPLEVAVLAAADAEVLFLNSVQALSCARPGAAEFTRNLLTILAGRNLTLTRKIGHMARRTTRDKLLSYLSAQAMQAGGPEFDIPLDRQKLDEVLK